MTQQRVDFIKLHKDDVINATLSSGIFPSVTMAQMIIESSNSQGLPGQGITAVKANNYFGIKANSSWKGEKMAFNTPKDGQPVNYFRVYKSVKDSIKDHTTFLKVNPRYNAIFSATNPFDQLVAIQKAGYAEATNYAAALTKVIKDYNLESLDEEAKKKDYSNI